MQLDKLEVQSQWNGKEYDMTINISNFPHLHSSLNNKGKYPHPYEYYLISLAGMISILIRDYTINKSFYIKNLYIVIKGNIDNHEINKFKEININIRLDSNAEPEEYKILQDFILHNKILKQMINTKIKIYWE